MNSSCKLTNLRNSPESGPTSAGYFSFARGSSHRRNAQIVRALLQERNVLIDRLVAFVLLHQDLRREQVNS